MTHAGTMDLGGYAQTRKGGGRSPAVMLASAVVVATIAAVWFASSTGLTSGTAKPAAGRSDAQVEAQRAITLAGNRIHAYDVYLDSVLNRAHAAAFAATLPNDLSARRGYAIQIGTGTLALPDNLSVRRGYGAAVPLPDNVSSARRGYPAAAASEAITLLEKPSARRLHAALMATLSDDLSSTRRGYPVETQPWRTFHLGR